MDWFEAGGSGNPVDVSALLDSEAMQHLATMVAAGALVSIGTTSDGGALGVTVTVDGRYRREYFRDGQALWEWTEAAVEPVTEAARSARLASASAVNGGGRRRR